MSAIMDFSSFRVVKTNCEIENDETVFSESENNTSFSVSVSNSAIEDGGGLLELEVNVNDHGEGYKREITVIIQGIFKFESTDTDYDLNSILRVNGSAILMPYVRNYISMLTGYDNSTNHILIPTINVQSIFEE